ncbi:MAG: NUDIX domain-containing protein, partial [Chloroflexi bacterium]
ETTFPKGTQDEYFNLQETAVKEVWEESGFKAKVLGLLGDYTKSTSVTRYYIGVVEDGAPWDAHYETEAVRIVPLADVQKLLNVGVDKEIFQDLQAVVAEAFGDGSAFDIGKLEAYLDKVDADAADAVAQAAAAAQKAVESAAKQALETAVIPKGADLLLSEDEAKEWVKDSAIPEFVYTRKKKHVVDSILQNGFDFTKGKANTWQTSGIYTSDVEPPELYGPVLMRLAIRAKNPFVGTVKEVEDKVNELKATIVPPKIVTPDGKTLDVRAFLTPADELNALRQAWLDAGYDAIIQTNENGSKIVVGIDPTKIRIIDDGFSEKYGIPPKTAVSPTPPTTQPTEPQKPTAAKNAPTVANVAPLPDGQQPANVTKKVLVEHLVALTG